MKHLQVLSVCTFMLFVMLACNQTTPHWVLDGGFIEKVPPELLAITVDSETQLTLVFSEPIQREDAEQVSNFVVVPDLDILEADLLLDNRTVELTTATHTPGESYQLTVSNVKDLMGNVIQPPNNQKTFTGFGSAAVNVSYQYNPVIYTINQPITPNSPTATGGTPLSFNISPDLPDGLILDTTTGILSGTPSAVQDTTDYTITITFSNTSFQRILTLTVLPEKPSNLKYDNEVVVYGVNMPITPNNPIYSGSITSFSVEPALPAGLLLDTLTGIITGEPTQPEVANTYVIIGCNAAGCTYGGVNIKVVADPPVLGVSQNLFDLGLMYYASGTASPSLSIDVTNTGVAALDWVASWDATWIASVSPALEIGLAGGGGSTSVTIDLDFTGIASGTYSDTLTFYATTLDTVDTPQEITIQVELRTWEEYEDIDSILSCSGIDCDMEFDTISNGNLMLVYEDASLGSFNYSMYDGTIWDDCGVSLSGLSSSTYFTRLGVNNNGGAIGLFIHEIASNIRVSTNIYNSSGCWMPSSEYVDDGTPILPDQFDYPAIAMNDNGEAIAIYSDSTDRLYANIYNGTSWLGTEIIDSIDSNPTQEVKPDRSRKLQVAMFPDGTAVAVWIQRFPYKIWNNVYKSGSWQGPEVIEAIDDVTDSFTATMMGTDEFWVAFVQVDTLYFKKFDGTSWTAPEIINPTNTCLSDFIDLETHPSGKAIYSCSYWDPVEGMSSNIRIYNGTSWEDEHILYIGNFWMDLAVNSEGQAMAIKDNLASHYDGTRWGPVHDFANASVSQLTTDLNGDFWVAYTELDSGSDYFLRTRRFSW